MHFKTLTTTMLLLFLWSCTQNKKTSSQQPNFIIIMADDLGYGDLSCYGNKKFNTPNIDKLAENGIRFTDFHSNGSVCSPTRAALITGKYQQRTGVEGVITAKSHREVGLPLSETTIAEALKNKGYNCAIFGKWHLGYSREFNPVFQGFDAFKGFVSGNVDYYSHIDQEGYFDWWNNDTLEDDSGYTTDLITEYGVKFIHASNPNKTKTPFFLYLPHESPHYPLQRRNDLPVRKEGSGAYIRQVDKDSIPAIYAGMVQALDEGIGNIIDALNDTGQLENTVIVFLSDNGATKNGSNGDLRGYKSGPFEGGSRVPAIISYPDKINAGRISDEIASSMDVFPTFMDIIDALPSDNKFDGISLKKHLFENEKLNNRNLFYSFKNRSFIRSGPYKLITTYNKNTDLLFNLDDDIGEKINLVSEQIALRDSLQTALKNWHAAVRENVKMISD